MQPTRNTFMQTCRALCHSHMGHNERKQRTINAQGNWICSILVHSCRVHGSAPSRRVPDSELMHLLPQELKLGCARTAMRSIAALVLMFVGLGMAHSQAPIRERSDAVSGIDGARRAADVARNGLVAADSRQSEANARVKKAEDSLLAAQKEIAAARTEKAAADRAQEAARTADERARAALARALDARK